MWSHDGGNLGTGKKKDLCAPLFFLSLPVSVCHLVGVVVSVAVPLD